jgi:hypothetical protein
VDRFLVLLLRYIRGRGVGLLAGHEIARPQSKQVNALQGLTPCLFKLTACALENIKARVRAYLASVKRGFLNQL